MEIHGYNMSEELYYEENHFWVKEEGELLVMGMDDFGQKIAGQIVYVQLPETGKELAVGKKLARIESGTGHRILPDRFCAVPGAP